MYRKIFKDFINNKSIILDNDIIINCPFHNDRNPSCSVSIDENKPIYHCFSCGAKGSWIGAHMKLNNFTYQEALADLELEKAPVIRQEKIKPVKKYQNYSDKVIQYQNNFYYNYEKSGKLLYNNIGLTLYTAMSVGIGYGDSAWLFPIYKYPDYAIVGYELRKEDFKNYPNGSKCLKPKLENDYTLNCLSVTYRADNNKRVIICEGFKDSYFLYQWLFEKGQGKKVEDTIMTPSCGVRSLLGLLEEYTLNEFEEILIILDNDKAGNEVKKELQKNKRYGFFKELKENEDFEIYYKRMKRK